MKRTAFFIITILALSIIALQVTHAQVVFEHGDSVYSVAFSPVDNTLLASGSSDRTVKLWDVETQTNIATLKGHTTAVFSIAFSPNGMLLASAGFDGTVKLWDVNVHTNVATLEGHTNGGTSVAFSPDGTTLAAGESDGIIKLWDVETHRNIATFGGYDAATLAAIVEAETERYWVTPVSFLSNTTVASGSGDRIKLWDVTTEKNIATFEVPGDLVWSMSCSPDGTTLAAGTYNALVQLWDVATGANTTTFPSVAVRSAWFVPPPAISFSPDGAQLAFTSTGVALWNIETGTQTNRLTGHTRVVRAVSFSPDGSMFASGAQDNTVRLWDLSSFQTALVASTASPLTETTLPRTVVTLTLNGHRFVDSEADIARAISVSGIEGVFFQSWSAESVERVSDMEVAIHLGFDGPDFDTDARLTFTVDGAAIVSPDPDSIVPGFTVQVPVRKTPISNATVSVAPTSVTPPAVGEQLTFNLNIADGENVVGYQATVLFDDSALEYIESANGDYLPADVFIADPVIDYTWIGRNDQATPFSITLAANTLAGAANGDGTLATVTFKGVDFKASKLTLSQFYLVDTTGKLWEATVENAEIVLPPEPAEALFGDINRDGIVNIQDLVIVGARLGQRGQNSADLNGDHLVDIVDLVFMANAFGAEAAAPSLNPQILGQLTAVAVEGWLNQARQLSLTDPAYLRGISVLEQLLMALTPKETALLPNFPNPFNPETWIPYHLAKAADVTLTIYAIDGQIVQQLTLGHQPVGIYQSQSRAAYWDGRNAFGEPVASGVYFYTLTAGDFTATRKMLIRK
ncbi:PD40 domain-containing protein [Candidatus Poribacteria bacterium]|nr:PD40 domain-containing protein [Candidatus Poribacteria bacterium]